jgi:hypothetical protein
MPFGAYECLTLPMGVMPASDLFQARMVHIFAELDEQRSFPYIDDILHFKGDTFEQHLSILDEILGLIGKSGLQVSAEKSRFCQDTTSQNCRATHPVVCRSQKKSTIFLS